MRSLILVVVTLAACGPPLVERSTRARFDSSSSDFWALPLPSDLRIQEDGSTDLEEWPGDWSSDLLTIWLRSANDRLRNGWGLTPGVFVQLTGPIDPDSLPADAAASTRSDATVFLLDVDPDSPERGQRIPVDVSFWPDGDVLAPPNLLAAVPVPGFERRPQTLYALVITSGVRDIGRERLGRSRAFHDAFEDTGDAPRDAVINLRIMRAGLATQDFDLGRVVGGAVFTTLDPNATLLKLAEWYEELEPPTLTSPWLPAEEYQSYQVLTARYQVPLIQSGDRPYERYGEGRIVWGDDGFPVVQETQAVRLALTIPKQPQPADGFPLTIYMHGSGGEYYQAINRGPREEIPNAPPAQAGRGPAEWLARRGVATVAFDYPLHGDRNSPPDTSGLLLYNVLGNPDATIDNFTIAAAETLYLTRLMSAATVDASLATTLDAGGAADGLIGFDPDRLTAMGQSMGTTLGIAAATVDPRIDGYIFSGTGGMLIDVVLGAHEPANLKPLFELIFGFTAEGKELHRAHPILHALQHLWDQVDPVARARWVSLTPQPGHQARDILMFAGNRDSYFHPNAITSVAVPLGVSLVGESVESTLPDALELAGRKPVDYPLAGNLNGRTAGVVHVAAPHELGHYVVFNQDGARFQFTCFAASVGTDVGATIRAPAGLDDPCD